MKKDDLIHADASPALSQNGQQTSVQTGKTMGQIAFEERFGTGAFWDQQSERTQARWGRVADAVIEECAKIADKREEQNQIVVDNNQDCPQTKGFFGAIAREAKIIASTIRSLKSSGRVVDRNAPGCDGRSLETKSFPAKEDADGNG